VRQQESADKTPTEKKERLHKQCLVGGSGGGIGGWAETPGGWLPGDLRFVLGKGGDSHFFLFSILSAWRVLLRGPISVDRAGVGVGFSRLPF